jgi:hypothetical protein
MLSGVQSILLLIFESGVVPNPGNFFDGQRGILYQAEKSIRFGHTLIFGFMLGPVEIVELLRGNAIVYLFDKSFSDFALASGHIVIVTWMRVRGSSVNTGLYSYLTK